MLVFVIQLLQYHAWMKFKGVGIGGRWEAEAGQYHPQGDKQQCCVFSRAQKLPQYTSQPGSETVISSSLAPQAALLVPHRPCSGPSWFYRVGKRPPVKADLAIYIIYSPIIGASG